jgi:glycosyltransferase involved in cell wall biosynthesis
LQKFSSATNDLTHPAITMPDRRFRVLAIASHPVQYGAPLFRLLAQHPQLDFQVAYCSLRGAEAGHDPDFGRSVKWDIPLLDGYAWTHLANRGSGSESFFGLNNPGLWRLIRRGHFDGVLSYTGYVRATFWISCFAAKLSHTAFLFGTDSISLASRDGRAWKRVCKGLFWPWLFRLADQVIAPSSPTRDLMLSLGIPPDRVTLIPYVVDNDWWIERSAGVDRAAVRASWGVAAHDVVILFCAKLQAWKRPFDVLRAFAKCNLPNARLVYAGDGPLHAPLVAEASALGIESRVRFLGFANQTQLPAIYRSADVMVLPSEYEPFAVVVNEAMCCGCPVIVSDRVGAGRDLVAPVCPEFIFPCGNVDALSEILARVVSGRANLREVGRRAAARVRAWSPQENIAATVEAIQRAAARVQSSFRKSPATLSSKSNA